MPFAMPKTHAAPLAAVLLAAAWGPIAANATPYDGLYQPQGSNWSCARAEIGMDGGALAIEGERLDGVENACTLADPVPVLGMDATLYDRRCSAEGTTYRDRVMLMRTERGVYVITDGFAALWERC